MAVHCRCLTNNSVTFFSYVYKMVILDAPLTYLIINRTVGMQK